MAEAENKAQTTCYLLLLPPFPINSYVVQTVLTAIRAMELDGYHLVPYFIPDGKLDLAALAKASEMLGEILPLVDLSEEQTEELRSMQVKVRPGLFGSSSPVFPLAAAIYGTTGRIMAQRMVSSGRRNLVYVASADPLLEPINQLRYAGVLQGCLLNGIAGPIRLNTDYHSQDLSGELVKLFAKNPDIDGFICHEDILAMETIQALRLCGRMVPNDCAVIGVDNTPEGALFNPPITSVTIDGTRVGELYAKAVSELLSGKEVTPADPAVIEKLTTLAVRGSG